MLQLELIRASAKDLDSNKITERGILIRSGSEEWEERKLKVQSNQCGATER